ncbi:hypothetical protein BBJ28_00022994 [Nothophytophthora sp. Chile5]|nr:hypothetical protein BBJ28_00022994 [Nothophytophthora sp. Chile5]
MLFSDWRDADGGATPALPLPPPFETATSVPDSDDVLLDFLQEMNELDRQPRPLETDLEPKELPQEMGGPRQAQEAPAKQRRAKEKAKATPKKSASMSWLRRKQELVALRLQTEKLENYAEFLQMRRMPEQLLLDPSDPSDLQTQRRHLLRARQEQWRAVQGENAVLKDQVQAYVQISGALQTLFTAATALQRDNLARNSIASRALRVEMAIGRRLDADNALIFDMLESSVNSRFDELAAIGREVSQPVTAADAEHIRIRRGDGDHAAVEFKMVRVLPFDVNTVSDVCWGVAQLGWNFMDRPGARVTKRSKDVISTEVCFAVALDNGEVVELHVRCLVKRFVVEEGLAIMAESVTEWPARLAAAGSWTHATREVGWGLIHPYPASNGASEPTASVMRSTMLTQPRPLASDPPAYQLLNTRAVNDVVIPSFRKLISNRQQFVDNLLLDGSFTSRVQIA